ncbi:MULTISPECIES: peptidoglycan recognition protein family protein [Lysinibacillus]|uniref:peptidoglycan recognition protein family protein n=1 Tax=Lysinibacillus TaxID=400634 RepID=UPI0021A333BD|nr:peptidoglycan recognition family protein [Lysinibacillus capsici]MCT1538388.1 peptidoglycan recognition protein family protein [Lysinibacillus capsici]MCT1569096.1 peptidoglycan recognition protein family protein [Lysinibacillus capsici]MCT1646111.1 peptidoglycan recognition protein family protein [Lysinibacillus capsici]MCT1725383.1 peptidoglycan recognition protein family protein [Lysinibacillus capsici]MCT1784163.1 peptidoglycan recognition protein family protein [Lysinibacillus capsici]
MSYLIEKRLMSGLPNVRLDSAKYVIAHESGNPNNCGPNALENEIAYMNRNKAKAFTSHWVGGGGRIVQIAPVNRVQYGCGPKGNPLSYAQVELARTNDKEQFKKDYAAYIWLLRELAKEAGIPVVLDGAGNGIKSHRWINDNLKGTTHRDPYDYLASMGISEAQFKLDILNGLEEVKRAQITEAKVMFNDTKTIPAVIIDGRTHVQVRNIADLLNLKLVYNNESKITKLYEVK